MFQKLIKRLVDLLNSFFFSASDVFDTLVDLLHKIWTFNLYYRFLILSVILNIIFQMYYIFLIYNKKYQINIYLHHF
ncbi:hypothetical protein OA85_03470 [Flavobacterium sp. AED]|nr:hypothetical protein OA85_03470 [Flavobacterium sp. AED]